MKSQTNIESQENMESRIIMESQTNTSPSSISTHVTIIKHSNKINEKKLYTGIKKLIEDLEVEAEKEKIEMLFKDKTVKEILHDLNNNVTREYIENIIKWSSEYKNNCAVTLIVQYYAYYYGIAISNRMSIFDTNDSRVILGLLLHISADILVKMSNDKSFYVNMSSWVLEELEYYKNNKNIRIDKICESVNFGSHSNIICDYLILNHIDLLRKHNITTSAGIILAEKITEMKDLLKI